jgi:hypothetical protein
LPTGTTIRVDRASRHPQRCRVSAAEPPHPLIDHSSTVHARPIPRVYRDSGRILWTGRVRGCFVHVPTGHAQDRPSSAGVPLGWTRGPHRPEYSGELGGRVHSGSLLVRWCRPVCGLWAGERRAPSRRSFRSRVRCSIVALARTWYRVFACGARHKWLRRQPAD